MISPAHYLFLSAILFAAGVAGVLIRRNLIAILMSIALMFNAALINLAAFSRLWGSLDGQVFAVMVMVIAAAEAALGIAMVFAFSRAARTADAGEMDLQKW